MHQTRRLILDLLKRNGHATLDQLAQEVGLVSMTVRSHLSVLERDGLVCYREERGKVGRPKFVYSLTETAQAHFPKSYHSLCNRILDALDQSSESISSCEFAERVADVWASEHAHRMCGQSLEDRIQAIATIRTEEGAMASVEETADGYLIHQRHCPAKCVAGRHPSIVCAAELGFIKRLVGAPVERVRWMLEGAETCSYHVAKPSSDVSPAEICSLD